jgi:hypothetical protein
MARDEVGGTRGGAAYLGRDHQQDKHERNDQDT